MSHHPIQNANTLKIRTTLILSLGLVLTGCEGEPSPDEPIVCEAGYELNDAANECVDINDEDINDSDINECETLCQDNAVCTNTEGSFECICATGYELNETGDSCADINECETICLSNATCTNIDGSFECICDEGYELNEAGDSCSEIAPEVEACPACGVDTNSDPVYCDYGETCDSSEQCIAHPLQSDLCAACGGVGLFPVQCPSDMFCAHNNNTSDAMGYCAPFCVSDNDCPVGYKGCGGITIYSETCTDTGVCNNNAPCLDFTQVKVCGCNTDNDCEQESAVCTDMLGTKSCENSGWPCETDDDCGISCKDITLDDGTTAGVCITTRGACRKGEDVSCEELTTGASECLGL